MKRNGLKEAVALAVCACTLGGSAAMAQVTIGWGSSNSVQGSLSSSSGYSIGHEDMGSSSLSASGSSSSSGVEDVGAALVINRFGFKDGKVVAYGRLVPTVGSESSAELNAGSTGGVTGGSGVLLSTPIEPAGGYGSDPRLGMGSRIAYSDVRRGSSLGSGSSLSSGSSLGSASSSGVSIGTSASLSSGSSIFDGSRLGNWTGIGSGYGESGVESRSNMTVDIDEPMSFNLGRPYDDVSYMEDITWSGHSTWNSDLAMSSDQEMLGDYEIGVAGESWSSSSSSIDDGVVLSLNRERPLVQLGGSSGLYSSAEAERAMMLMSSEDLPIPVTVTSASCDAVTLSFAGVESMTVTALSGSDTEKLSSTLCAISEATQTHVSEGQSAMLVKHLNRLISRTQ